MSHADGVGQWDSVGQPNSGISGCVEGAKEYVAMYGHAFGM